MPWMQELHNNISRAEELIAPFHLTTDEYQLLAEEVERFPMSVPRYYFSLIDPDDPNDPIRKMAIPAPHFLSDEGHLDTSGEHSNTVLQGVQHKYTQTLLVLLSTECAMYCRHCFRRRLVGKEAQKALADLDETAAYIEKHPEITNVLLSGGDALVVSDKKLEKWLDRLSAMKQLDFIRIGTRTPVTFPERITGDPALPALLKKYAGQKQLYVVTHFNHPREFTAESVRAVRCLQECGITVKNQTVLMRGINDDSQVLGQLLRKVTSIGMVQHYIFQCRPVQGVQTHFQVPLKEGLAIVQQACAMQNGLGKSADYTMSHVTGKIRILGEAEDGQLIFQYMQAKDPSRIGRIFTLPISDTRAWLPEE